MFGTFAKEVEQVLEKGDSFVLALAVGQEYRKVGREVSRLNHQVLERLARLDGLFPEVYHGSGASEGHFSNFYKRI